MPKCSHFLKNRPNLSFIKQFFVKDKVDFLGLAEPRHFETRIKEEKKAYDYKF